MRRRAWAAVPAVLLVAVLATTSGSRLGEKCEYDSDCDVAFSFCRAQQVCECKRGFETGPTTDRCVATLGAKCSSHYDCAGLPNSECAMEVCTCRDSFVPHSSGKECLKVAAMHMSSCTEVGQCTSAFGDRMECRDNRCQCIPLHHFSGDMCIRSKGLDEPCIDSRECYVSHEDDKNKQVACTALRCQCIMGFHMSTDHKTCTDGAAQLGAASLLASLVLGLFIKLF